MDTVLIVDDSSFIVEGLIAFLKKKFIPLAAYGGAECLEMLKRETPSVIILDIMMEPIDGWETLSRIKANKETRHIPVIMFSAMKISPEDAEKHGISLDDCLTKPISPGKIIEAIEKVILRRDTHRIIVERWQAAGVSQDAIDRYLSLVTSLEVDLSLCQNLKIQYDLGHPEDQDQKEFLAVISAIRDRILQERDQIEALAREMNQAVEQADTPLVNGRGNGRQVSTEPGNRDQAAAGMHDERFARREIGEKSGGAQIADIPNALQGDPGSPDTDVIEKRAAGIPAVPVSSPDPGDDAPPLMNPGPDLQGSRAPPVDAVRSSPVPPESAPPDPALLPAGPLVTGTGEPGPRFYGQVGSKDEDTPEDGLQPDPRPLSPVTAPLPHPLHDLTRPGNRNAPPANPGIPQNLTGTSSTIGAGTDVPMPWSSLRKRNPLRIIAELKAKAGVEATDPVSQPRGIFARIVSLVRSLFG